MDSIDGEDRLFSEGSASELVGELGHVGENILLGDGTLSMSDGVNGTWPRPELTSPLGSLHARRGVSGGGRTPVCHGQLCTQWGPG